MKLSVIIVNYNVRAYLEQCLRTVEQALIGVDGEVYVVDNQSTDGSVEMVRSKFPNVKLIANAENVGFSRANNQAIRASNAEYVVLLNPDTVVAKMFSKRSSTSWTGIRSRWPRSENDRWPWKLPSESKRGLPPRP